MMTDFFRDGTLLLFWFIAFNTMLIITIVFVTIGCYFLKQLGEELREEGYKRKMKNASSKNKQQKGL